MKKRTLDFIEKYQIHLFFALAYCISWFFWLLSDFSGLEFLKILGTFGPAFSAISLTILIKGKEGLMEILKRCLIWKVDIRWYLFCFFSTAAVALLAICIYKPIGVQSLSFENLKSWYLIPVIFLYVLFFSVLGEEVGWRGFALPILQKKCSALLSGIIIGIIWGIWHLPLFFLNNDFHEAIPFWLFLMQSIALSVIMTWVYNNTRGSLLIAHLFHTASNVTVGLLPILPMNTNGDILPLYITVMILVVLTITIGVITGAKKMKLNKTIS